MQHGLDIDAYFSDEHPAILDEVTYKELMHVIDPRDLPHRDYAPLIPYVRYEGFRYNTMKFFVPNKVNGWSSYVRFPQWQEQVADTSLTAQEAARLLLWGDNLRLHCGCPAFLFWGYKFILTQLGASIHAETRFPHIRNPDLKGIACKHLRRVIKVLPFHLGTMANLIKQQRG